MVTHGRIIGPVPDDGGYRGECRGCYHFAGSSVWPTMREAVRDPEVHSHRCEDQRRLDSADAVPILRVR